MGKGPVQRIFFEQHTLYPLSLDHDHAFDLEVRVGFHA